MSAPSTEVPGRCRIDPIEPLLAEFNAMYVLAQLRLTALDGRIPTTSALLAGVLTSIAVLPSSLQVLLLAGLPVTTIYLVRTTIGHARSLQDCLTRIAEIESQINDRAGEVLIRFQRSHPSRKVVGSRTGSDTIEAVMVASALLLAGCLYMLATVIQPTPMVYKIYCAYTGVIGCLLLGIRVRFDGYRYQPIEEKPSQSEVGLRTQTSLVQTPRL
jgi:hypothetical protein